MCYNNIVLGKIGYSYTRFTKLNWFQYQTQLFAKSAKEENELWIDSVMGFEK